MARRGTTSFARTNNVVLIGQNALVVPTVAFFVGGKIPVRVFTCDLDLEDKLALYPGVSVTMLENYATPPADLPDAPYFICVDQTDLARSIKQWLPDTLAIFHLTNERRGKTAAPGFRSMAEPTSAVRRRLMRRLATIRRVDRLGAIARNAELPLILIYGDPDPDAIGAALGLTTIWRNIGANPLIRYTGEVRRYQNKLLLNYLAEPIERLRESEYRGADVIALVDAQPGFWSSDPPRPQVIIDHHPRQEATNAYYLDIRERYGSTCTILSEYLLATDFKLSRRLATALSYGIKTDTSDLQRNTSKADVQIYEQLLTRADQHFLSRLSKSQVPMNMLDHIAWGIQRRLIYRDLMLIHFGEIDTPDMLVQVADLMLLTCGINWVVCAGKHGDAFTVIFRGDGHRQDVGARATSAFGKFGSAGGHRTMGRAEIPLHGEHVDATCDLLIDNLFKRMAQSRRQTFIRELRNHLHGPGPDGT